MSADWLELGPGQITGFGGGQPDQGSGGVESGVSSTVQTRAAGNAPWYSPDNPLFWVAGLLAAVTGAITLSTTVNLGPLKGKGKV